MSGSTKSKLLFPSVIAIIILMCGVKSSRSFALRTLKKGDRIPDYEVTLLDGSSKKLTDLSGEKGLLMIFWTTWSERSLQLLTFAESELRGTYGVKGVKILGFNVERQSITDEDERTISEILDKLGITIPVGIDRGLMVYDEIGVISTPTSILITKDLILENAYPGFPTVAKEEIPEILNAFLGIEEVKPPEDVQYLLARKPKNNALLYYNLGKNLYKRYLSKKGELRRAPKSVIEKLDESIKRDPDFYSPYILKAIIYYKAKDETNMEETLKTIDEKGFTEPLEMRDLAYMYLILDMDERSSELLEKLQESIPDEPTVTLLQSLLAVKSERADEASPLLKKILENGNLTFDLGAFIDPETGTVHEGVKPGRVMDQISEKVLNISKK